MVDWTGDVADSDDDIEPEPEAEPEPETDGGTSALADSVLADIEEQEQEQEAEADGSDEPDGDGDEDGDGEDADLATDADEAEGTDSVDEVTDAIADVATDAADDDFADEQIDDTEPIEDLPTDAPAATEGYINTRMLEATAPNAIPRESAAQKDPRWTFLVWGDEGTGKSHFAHTAPEPICYLDTEGKASNLADKFEKEVVYFDATDYDKARESLVQSLDLLAEVKSAHGVVGTIVVDSMSKLWEFAQQKHVDEHYVTKESPAEVTFKSGLQGGDDWKKIKKYHNARFRDVLADCPYHVILTAMAEEDYNAVMEGAEGKPMKPQGEKNNKYAVENIIQLRAGESGDTVGDLLKTDRTRLRFRGLEWPVFDDAVDFIQRISEAERSEGSVDVDDWPVDIVRGSPADADTATEDDDE